MFTPLNIFKVRITDPVSGATSEFPVALQRLTPILDAHFKAFYGALLAGGELETQSFDRAAHEYFDSLESLAQLDQAERSDAYFNCFTPAWRYRLSVGQTGMAVHTINWGLRAASSWERSRGRHLHKGSAYYFLAVASLLANDVDAGYLFAHAALEEDVRTHGNKAPATPSLALAVMDSDPVEQLFRPYVVQHAALVEGWLSLYRGTHGKTLDFQQLRAKYLLKEANRERAFLFAYAVARLQRHADAGAGLAHGVFESQVLANLLFDVALLVDAAIPHAGASRPTFLPLAVTLSDRAGLGLTKDDLRELNRLFNNDFNSTTVGCLDGTHTLTSGAVVQGLSASLALTYGYRNRGAHDVSAAVVTASRFPEIRTRLFDCLFLAVETFL